MNLPRRLAPRETVELVEHLGELRTRLIVCLLAVGAAFALTYAFHERLLTALSAPLPAGHSQPITLGIAEPFMTSLKVSFYAAVLLSLPVLLWQLWSFIAPALEEGTQRAIAGLVAFSGALLAAGLGFGYFLALPASLNFLTTYDEDFYDIQVRASSYYSFASAVLLATGLVFELPVFLLALVRLGVTSAAKLRRNRRLGYVLVTALAVALPGVDPFTTALEIVPLAILFEGSILLAAVMEKRWQHGAVRAADNSV